MTLPAMQIFQRFLFLCKPLVMLHRNPLVMWMKAAKAPLIEAPCRHYFDGGACAVLCFGPAAMDGAGVLVALCVPA